MASQRLSQLRTSPKLKIFTPAELNGDFPGQCQPAGPDTNSHVLQQFPFLPAKSGAAAQAIIDPRGTTLSRDYIKAI